MQEALAVAAPKRTRFPLSLTIIRASVPSLRETALTLSSAILLILSFPNFDLWWLAWIGVAPLIIAVSMASRIRTAFLLGLLWGTIFFYGTCWWLTYPMIHYGHVPGWLAYPLLVLPVILGATFPALACAFISQTVSRFGSSALWAAPIFLVSLDWLRYAITGEVWNAIGYSQAFHPFFIQPARWGGVYLVTFLILTVNAAIAFVFRDRTRVRIGLAIGIVFLVAICSTAIYFNRPAHSSDDNIAFIVAVQPNVPMENSDARAMAQLLQRHVDLSKKGLRVAPNNNAITRLVIWPESPMNFSYTRDPQLQNVVGAFARANHTLVLLNSLESAPNDGSYNSAILVNQEGQKVARYDKIRLMPFGEYVPLPRWLPGSGSVRGIVGEFTPGSSYTLMPLGAIRAGVFICVEAIHPSIARTFTNNGADVLINISNDGYLGPTAVMRGHLANAVFRAVENNRDVIRVTNSGISAYIRADGSVSDETKGFQQDVRTWTISKGAGGTTFYARHGDVFVYLCALITLGIVSATLMRRRSVQ